MNTIIFQTIRSFAVFSLIFFAFAGEAFAAPTFLPTSSLEITGTGATVRAYIQNPGELAVVWFEWSEASSTSTPNVIGMSNYFGDGFFAARLEGLTPGVIYSYRAVAKSGGATVYSPTASFRTLGGSAASATTGSSQGALGLGSFSDGTGASTSSVQTSSNSNNTQTAPVASQTTQNTTGASAAKSVASVSSVSKKSNTAVATKAKDNTNMAAVAGAGNSMLPSTLVGWVGLIIAVLVIVLLITMISESSERRKRIRTARKENEDMTPAHA